MKKILIFCSIFLLVSTLLGGLLAFAETNSLGDLSEQQKREYYKQYQEIVEAINSENPRFTLELVPFEDFKSEDYVEPSEFKKYAIGRANAELIHEWKSNSDITPLSTASASKQVTVDSKGTSVGITIKGSFETQYDSQSNRQFFAGINSITSSSDKGTWNQTGYTPRLIDGRQTYEITVGGRLTLNSITTSHNITVEFYCDANGRVS